MCWLSRLTHSAQSLTQISAAPLHRGRAQPTLSCGELSRNGNPTNKQPFERCQCRSTDLLICGLPGGCCGPVVHPILFILQGLYTLRTEDSGHHQGTAQQTSDISHADRGIQTSTTAVHPPQIDGQCPTATATAALDAQNLAFPGGPSVRCRGAPQLVPGAALPLAGENPPRAHSRPCREF